MHAVPTQQGANRSTRILARLNPLDALVGLLDAIFAPEEAAVGATAEDATFYGARHGFTGRVTISASVWAVAVRWSAKDDKKQIEQDQLARLDELLAKTRSCTRSTGKVTCFFDHLCIHRDGISMHPQRLRLKAVWHHTNVEISLALDDN
ncbi:hypothetical protein ACPRNU_14165 [Chromobacterium vaccinii]|uniref:hypothetical protein n=1 Tax=Chromobacterium vaccinii TaxID=1108595 RepID=UPI003C76671F